MKAYNLAITMFIILIIFFIAPSHANLNNRTIIYGQPSSHLDPVDNYYVKLLQQALSYTEQQLKLQPAKNFTVQSRALKELGQPGGIDVYWSMTSKIREQEHLPVRIPLDKGMIGWRLLLVNKPGPVNLAKQNKRSYRMVQGHDWPDTEILQHNSIPVETSASYELLFAMLTKGRADAMPRAAVEIETELAGIASGLFAAPDILLYYPAAQYFFVAKDDTELAAMLEQGLRRMMADGTFEQLFQQTFGSILQQLHQEQRQVLKLHNPLLPTDTPIDNPALWQPLPSHYQQITW